MPTIEMRRPDRRIGGLILVVVGVALGTDFLRSGSPTAGAALFALALAGVRMASERVWTDDNAVHARNFWHTCTAPRSQIVEFLVEDFDGAKQSRTRTTWVHLVGNGTFALSATGISYHARGWRTQPYARNRADDTCDRLNAWLRPPT